MPFQLPSGLPQQVGESAGPLPLLVLPLDLTGVPHDDVDEGVLNEAAEYKDRAGVHEHIDGLDVGDRRQGLLAVGVLGGEGQQGGHAQGHAGGHGLGLDPETDPGHDDDQTGGDVGVEEVVAQPPLEHEHHLQTREISCKGMINDHLFVYDILYQMSCWNKKGNIFHILNISPENL